VFRPRNLRIVVWNCRMGFSQKREALYALKPDLAVIPECSKDAADVCRDDGYETCWWGDNRHKGLAVLVAKPWSLKVGNPPTQRWIAPVLVSGPTRFLLIAVWACRVGEVKEFNYIGQVFEGIKNHRHWFSKELPTVFCGDLNSNATFRSRKVRNHNAVVRLLEERGLVSAYHTFFSERHGEETRPTHYLLFQRARPFHLDYIFLPRKWMTSLSKLTVGTYEDYRPVSDHVPLIADLCLKT
jgi:endonuclease/exonuclease/phosphatase family metal-dependent hydrolase